MSNDLDRKFFHALLNGVTQSCVYHKPDITFAYLQEQLFGSSSMSPAEQVALLEEIRRLITLAAKTNISIEALETLLKETQISEEQQIVFVMFWKTERPKVHDFMVSQSTWEPTLQQLSWRIDVKTAARGATEINQPTAIVEMLLSQGGKFQFEVSRQEVTEIQQTLDAIQNAIKDCASGSSA